MNKKQYRIALGLFILTILVVDFVYMRNSNNTTTSPPATETQWKLKHISTTTESIQVGAPTETTTPSITGEATT